MHVHDALTIAIEAMGTDIVLLEPQARDWRKYGEALLFNKIESRQAAEHCDKLAEAITVLKELRDHLSAEGTPAVAQPGRGAGAS